jgi:hypothetical protein
MESMEEETMGDWGRRKVASVLPSELGREKATLLRGLPRGEESGEAPGMRWTRESYLSFRTRLSSCRVLTSCEVIPKPEYMHQTSVDGRSFSMMIKG